MNLKIIIKALWTEETNCDDNYALIIIKLGVGWFQLVLKLIYKECLFESHFV